jgi:signal transduction histidine kinase
MQADEFAGRTMGSGSRDHEVVDRLRLLESAIGRVAAAEDPGEFAVLLSAEAHGIAAASVTVFVRGVDGLADVEARDGVVVDLRDAAMPDLSVLEPPGTTCDDAGPPFGHPLIQRLPLVDGRRVVGTMIVEYPVAGRDPDEDRLSLVHALAAAAGSLAGRIRERAERHVTGNLESARPSDAARAERLRIARELHDGLIQSLYGMGLLIRTQAERTDLPERGRQTMARWVRRIDGLVDEATAYISDLEGRGDALIDLGAGIDAIAEEAAAAGLDVSTEVNSTDDSHLSGEVCHELLVVAREAASNAIRHASAHRLAIRVEVDPVASTVTLTVDDDGAGFEPARHRPGGHGLDNIASRAAALKGSLDVISRRQAGTRVRLRVPMHPPELTRSAAADNCPGAAGTVVAPMSASRGSAESPAGDGHV